VAPLVGVVDAVEGKELITLGERSQLVILMFGSVSIFLGNGECVAKVPAVPGDASLRHPCFGELGLLHNKPATATVRAASTVKCLTVSRANFSRFLANLPDFEERCQEVARCVPWPASSPTNTSRGEDVARAPPPSFVPCVARCRGRQQQDQRREEARLKAEEEKEHARLIAGEKAEEALAQLRMRQLAAENAGGGGFANAFVASQRMQNEFRNIKSR
jgi:hypothetical protein